MLYNLMLLAERMVLQETFFGCFVNVVYLFKGNYSVEFIWLPTFSTQITRQKRSKKGQRTNIGNYLGRHTSL